jgi:hypothetical protein
MERIYQGSCHCGAVRFTARVDVSAGTGKCNCSICRKMRLWSFEAGEDTFTLIAGAEALTDYVGRNEVAQHFFCATCGIHAFDRIDMPNMSGHVYYNVSVDCLDGLDVDELMAAPVNYYDGLRNAWHQRPDEVRHL